jgi:hypothetical protein
MALSTEQNQMRYVALAQGSRHATGTDMVSRFLAIVLPSLTLCTHTLLALSFLLPGSDLDRASFSISYNVLAGSASILGLLGAVRVSQALPRDLCDCPLAVYLVVSSRLRSESQSHVHSSHESANTRCCSYYQASCQLTQSSTRPRCPL